MMLTCVMPFYNNQDYIEEALNSLVALNYNDYEIILVDDGSEDNSTYIAEKFCNRYKNIKIIKHQTNKGVAQALKTCIKYSGGEYILFAAADDISLPQRAKKCMDVFMNHENVGIIISNAEIIDAESNLTGELYKINEDINDHNIFLEQLKRNYCLGATMAIKKDTNILLREDSLLNIDDYEISLDYILAGYDIHIINEPLIKYRVHKKSISNNKRLLYEKTVKSLKKYNSEDFKDLLLSKGFNQKDSYLSIGIFELFRLNYTKAIQYLRFALEEIVDQNLDDFEIYFYLSSAYYGMGLFNESYQYALRALSLNNEEPTVLNNIGVLLCYLNYDSKKALKYLRKGLQIQPLYLDVYSNLQILLGGNYLKKDLKFTSRLLSKSIVSRENYII
ncbi:hypothetical protein CVD28_09325 [Bacillus sp. M6-12]|uniref:glycosyltransferase n=1 Tax=Bacillus sp. M6-12 TaxID=2054166 RepID=UPI000C77CA5A|nr:glycosyltransferase [Bacillus sp. M6-12]PLS17884.1 hypothetical protein CVD28_09325 [Bacillus sp. M6-12]